jgi:hypothetical protein
LLPDWTRLTAFLSLVEKAWPRGDQGASDPTALEASYQTEPAPTEESPRRGEAEARDDHRFGRFQILRVLGQGGFGIVFLAWDPTLRRQVALKVPQPEALMTAEARKRFQREAHAAAGLDHPNIVPVYESGSVGSVTYIAAAYCPGPTLTEWLARQMQAVPPRDAAVLVATLARAVDHAHERGVLHRDLKPSNILLKHAGADGLAHGKNEPLGGFEPRITDFSLARIADGLGPDTKSGVPFGSPPYMAPEQAEGKLTMIAPHTDVYGLGCILYELLTGAPPFRGNGQLDTLRQVVADAPIPPRRIRRDTPVDLETIALKCLEKIPDRRYTSAALLADDLQRFIAGDSIAARPASRLERIRRWCIRPERSRDAALFLLALGLGFATFCAVAIVILSFQPMGFARPDATRVHAVRCIFLFYLPLAFFGKHMLAHRAWAFWGGLIQSVLLTIYMILSLADIIIFDFGAGGPDARAGRFVFELLCLTLFAFAAVSCVIALTAHYANPRSARLKGRMPESPPS